MSITVSVPDALRQSVEASSGGLQTVLYDDQGYPSIMNVIPKFMIEDIDAALGAGVHPAFTVNGAEKSELFIGSYQAMVHDNRALSLPGQEVRTNLDFDEALDFCAQKGPGWHLMTNAEWSAVALWCWANGTMPRGNTDYGRDHSQNYETGRRANGGVPGDNSGAGDVLSGSGPASWRHNAMPSGISDLCGNVHEWVGGLRLQDGEIQVIPDNNAAAGDADHSSGSSQWRAILQDGSLVTPGTADTLKYDATGTADNSDPEMDISLDNQMSDPDDANSDFESLAAATGVTVPDVLKQLGLFPGVSGLGGDRLWLRNYGERLPIRGGNWDGAANAGVFTLDLNRPRSGSFWSLGFRPAFAL